MWSIPSALVFTPLSAWYTSLPGQRPSPLISTSWSSFGMLCEEWQLTSYKTTRFRVVFVHLIPCVSLVLLNILLCNALRKADERRERLLMRRQKTASTSSSGRSERWSIRRKRGRFEWHGNVWTPTNFLPSSCRKNQESRHQRDAQSTTMMLIVVIAVFLSTEIPLMVITVLHTLSNRYVRI